MICYGAGFPWFACGSPYVRRNASVKDSVLILSRTLTMLMRSKSSGKALTAMTLSCFIHPRLNIPRKYCENSNLHSREVSSLPQSPPSALSLIVRTPSPVLVSSSSIISSDVTQRSEEWFTLRKDKLTTSTFSTALGFWRGNKRSDLWYEKVFTPDVDTHGPAAKAAMDWGVLHEPAAIERYKSITCRDVGLLGFAIHADAKYGWLGASPDGLIGCYPEGGILEVKCPYNKGRPENAPPWRVVPYYYIPQVQGQMEIMDRDWVDLYCWTPKGSSLFRVFRDRAYWEMMNGVLWDFWWGSVVPAREALLTGKEIEARSFEPKPKHELTGALIASSRKIAAEARLLFKDSEGNVQFFS